MLNYIATKEVFMKNNVNGWRILATELERIPGAKDVLQDFWGEKFDFNQIADGKHLLDSREIELIFQMLRTDSKTRMELLNMIITSRNHLGLTAEIAGFRKLFSEAVSEALVEVPVVSLETVENFCHREELLSEFISREAVETESLLIPAGSGAVEIDEKWAQALELPPGTLLIVNGAVPAVEGETALMTDDDGTFSVGIFSGELPLKWSVPVLRIHFRLQKLKSPANDI